MKQERIICPSIMKTFWRIVGRIIAGVFYYSSALILATIFTLGIFAGIGYHYYNSFYKEYMAVQQKWAKLDNTYVTYINKIQERFELLKEETKDKDFESKEKKEAALQKINLLENHLRSSIHSMSYKEKFTAYPSLMNAMNDLESIHANTKTKSLQTFFNELNTLENQINTYKAEYNKAAKSFNEESTKFPEKIILEIGSFHTWLEIS